MLKEFLKEKPKEKLEILECKGSNGMSVCAGVKLSERNINKEWKSHKEQRAMSIKVD